MAPTDPHQGGDLFDMAKDGTTMPNDAGVMNLIPSVPRPGEGEETANANRNALAAGATNPTDIPRSTRDMGSAGEVETGTGDLLPAQVDSKRLHYGANNPSSKGHDRADKNHKQQESDLERYATDGPGMDQAPGDENLESEELDKVVQSREEKQT